MAAAKRPVGRPDSGYKTVNIRSEAETYHMLRKLSGLAKQSVPEFMKEWLLPVLREEYAKRIRAENREIGKQK